MSDLQELTIKINFLRNFLKKNSINESSINCIEYFLKNEFSYLTNLTFKKQIDRFQRVTVNSRICDGNQERLYKIDQLIYHPNGAKEYGRANIIGDKILYGTDDIPTALMEARVKENDLVTISNWKLKTNHSLCITPIFKNFPIRSNVISIDFFDLHRLYWETINKLFNPQERAIAVEFVQFLTDCFTKDVDENNHFDYFLSSFYANRLLNFLDNGSIEAILYPSMRNDLITTNIAMKHDAFNNNYELEYIKESIVIKPPFGINNFCKLKLIAYTNVFKGNEIIW